MDNKERSYELRSERVRSIVGQIPPALLRYGTIILFAVLLVLFCIAYFMPYKQVYSGTITFYNLSEPSATAYLSFDNDKVLTNVGKPMPLSIYLDTQDLTIYLTSIESKRDTLNRYSSRVAFLPEQRAFLPKLKNITVDFTIVESEGSLLSQLIPIFK